MFLRPLQRVNKCKNKNNQLLSATTGFTKVGKVAPLGAMTDTQGATSSKAVRVRAM